MEPRTHRLDGLADAATALAGELSLERVLARIVELAAQVTGARYAALGVLGADGTIERFLTHGLDDETVRSIGRYPTGKGVLGLLIREARVLRLDDVSAHPEAYGFPPNHPPMTSFVGAPVRSRGQVYGNLYLTDKPGGFDTEDEHLLVVLAAQAGAAIDNALLSEQLQQLAVASERERLARELHDRVIQSLFSTGLGLETARTLVATDPERARERLEAAVDGIDGAIRELRSAIFHLQPVDGGDVGLGQALVELAREHEIQALTRPTLDVAGDVDAAVPAGVVPDVLAIVREALSNASRHARAREIAVRAWVEGRRLHLEVADDGLGFDPDAPRTGRGLDNIADRADAVGATLGVRTTPGEGTTLALALDLPDAPERDGAARDWPEEGQ